MRQEEINVNYHLCLLVQLFLSSSFIGNCILNKLYNQYLFTKPHLKETICIKKDKSTKNENNFKHFSRRLYFQTDRGRQY